MSNMALRSSRSRSKTPFVSPDLMETETAGNHIETTYVRTTRRTVIKGASSTDEVNTSRDVSYQTKPVTRSAPRIGKAVKNKVWTSDYSSEDGEMEVSSTKTIRQNEKNQLIEDAAKTVVNGRDMPALDLYKQSGRYWDEYPKTDWTYSRHSKDRVEIAPGVVAMPNMSRKTIHSLDGSSRSFIYDSSENLYSENVAHKNVNTDELSSQYTSSETVKRSLFNNNTEDYYIKRRSFSRWSSLKSSVRRMFTSIFSVFYYLYVVQTSTFSFIHRVASKVMLWDTYLVWKTKPGDKATKLALLCLLPLLLLGGIWFISCLGGALYGLLSNTSTSWAEKITAIIKNVEINDALNLEGSASSEHTLHIDKNVNVGSDLREKRNIQGSFEPVIQNYAPPTAAEIASSFTTDQLEAIALVIKNSLDLEENRKEVDANFVEKIIQNSNFHNLVTEYYIQHIADNNKHKDSDNNENLEVLTKHELLINSLVNEINAIKQDITQKHQQSSDYYHKLSLDMKKCCNKQPVINVEGYVGKIVTDLLNNPEFLENQKGLNDWLKSLFVAKQQLHFHLGNITANVDDRMASLIESNSQTIMNTVTAKMVELNKKHVTVIDGNTIGGVSEEEVKRIVQGVLAVYDADKTGLVDYAMESMGGQIITTRCTELYHYGKAVVSVLGIPLWSPSNSPRTLIRPSVAPGECWAFQNFPGFVVIKLSTKIKVEAFSFEHISRLLVPEGKIDSAPKEFEVYGLSKENDKDPVLLGTYTYDYDGDPLQFFPVQSQGHVFDMVELRVVSNHGNPNYTCLYRFRVHGQLYHTEGR